MSEETSMWDRMMNFAAGRGALKKAAATGEKNPAPPAKLQSTDYLKKAVAEHQPAQPKMKKVGPEMPKKGTK